MTSTTSTFTFRPWLRNEEDDTSLGSVLTRIQLDRGHFRDITEQSLQEELATEGALQLSESDESSEDSEDDGEAEDAVATTNKEPMTGKIKSIEDLVRAKMEMLQHIKAAQDDIDYARDFVSLLISKDLPRQAQISMAPNLLKEIPMGTLGVDMWDRMPANKVRETQDETLAVNVRMEGLQQSADGLLAAATRLEDNMRRETQYWDQILSIADQGWNVSKMPGRTNRLGVRFGFNESAPDFVRRGLAALDVTSNGNIALDSAVGGHLKAVRATLRVDGSVVGVSRLPDPPGDGQMPLGSRIRNARDSPFDEELYHEMIRESRSIAALGVRMEETAITCPIPDAGTEITFDLVPLDSPVAHDPAEVGAQDELVQAAVLATRLLLTQAHRDRLAKKSEIPVPLSERQEESKPVLPILRPIMAFLMHQASLDRLRSYASTLRDVFGAAGVSVELDEPALRLPDDTPSSNPEGLVTMFIEPWSSDAKLTFTSPESQDSTFQLRIETTLARNWSTVFIFSAPSSSSRYQFNDFDDFVRAADDKIASHLAKALARSLGDGWHSVDREASLQRNATALGKNQRIWISLDSGKKSLVLSSSTKREKWTVGATNAAKGFWEAGTDLSQ